MEIMWAGCLVGLDISVNKVTEEVDGEIVVFTVATVSIYPHVINVKVREEEPYTALLERIRVAIVQLHAFRNTQF